MTLSSAALLRPQSLSLIGVSDDPSKTAGRPLQFLRRAGFDGEIFVVNPPSQGDPSPRSACWPQSVLPHP